MDSRLQRRVQRYGWNKAATAYERYWANPLEPAQRRLLQMAALAPGERVLDVACGTGLVTFRAAEQVGPGGAVFGTDISEAMVAQVRDEAVRRGLSHVSAERFDAEDASVPDGSFDVALCALGLMYVADPGAALVSMRRALRADGRLVAAVWGERARCGWAEIFPIVERRVASDVCPMFFQLGTSDGLRWIMERVGLDDITVERLPTTLHYDSAEDACGAAFAGGPVALAYSHFDAATRDAAHAEYLESIARFRNGQGFDVAGEFVIASGRA